VVEKTWVAADCVVFRKTTDPYGGLSNMAAGYPLNVAGERFRTSEALYQACRFPHAPEVQYAILAEASPMVAKWISKKHRKLHGRDDWEQIQVEVMRWCLLVKAAQHVTFGRLLRVTGRHAIVEESSRDRFWGARREPDGTLIGSNMLGVLLVQVRDELKAGTLDPTPPSIPELRLFGRAVDAS
jgi:ribA/ribD-fused uncharacterized protein